MKTLARTTVTLFVALIAASPGVALIGETPTIRAIAVVRTGASNVETVALIDDTALNLRTVNKENGALAIPDQVVMLPEGAAAADVIFSTAFRPNSILVLREDLSVLEYPVAFDADSQPRLVGDTPAIHGPFGDPATIGFGTALAEAPGATSKINFLAIGTTSGHGALVQNENVDTIDLGKGEITGLGAVPQVGYFAFIAAHNGRVVGVNPNTSSIVFDLADPRPDPLLDLSTGAVFEQNSEPLTEPAPVSFVAANGTPDVAVLEIPANPAIGGTMKVGIVVIAGCPIAEVDRGSLFMLEAGGEALLYDPGFTLDGGGSGVVFTIAGASLDLDPDVLNFGSKGNYVTATIEVENDHATAIDTGTIALEYGGSSVLSAPGFPPQIGDSDEDGQADVLAKFDRAAVQAMLNAAPEGPVTLEATWTFNDGSPGSAAGTIRVIK